MKERTIFRGTVATIVLAALVVLPALAQSATLSLLQKDTREGNVQDGPQNTIDLIAEALGFDIIGPGGALTGITVSGTGIDANVTASSFLSVSWWQVWDYGQTQTARQRFWWGAIYQLNGTPGETADISLDYTLTSNWFDLGIDGRTQSKSYAGFFTAIVPPDQLGTVMPLSLGLDFWSTWLQCLPNQPTLGVEKNQYFGSGASDDQTDTGSIPLGTMHAGDQLHFFGTYYAQTQAQAYAFGVNIATMVSKLDLDLVVASAPVGVPEPATLLLLGLGIVGLLGVRRLQK
jgi:hypothetical protein